MSALASRARSCVASTSRSRQLSSLSGGTCRALSTVQSAVHPPRSRSSLRPPVRCLSSSSRVLAKKSALDTYQGKRIDMNSFPPERIRNLSIIAHIDHGKSTLADRLLQMTGTVPDTANPQFLDKLKVERERGITVKAQTVSIIHKHTDGKEYLINLIDTPGHVDFSYEVSRSIGACEGGLILVDCTQGIQAQTLSVFHVALEADLTLLAVINKVDLPHASPQETSEQIEGTLGLLSEEHMLISAKSGLGVGEVLKQIIEGLPPPKHWEQDDGKLRGLVFDTYYDHYRGVVALVRLFSGEVRVGDKIRFLQADKKYEVLEIGVNNPEETPVELLKEGQVGYLVCSMKSSEDAHIGDTICHERDLVEPLPGFKPMKAMVYAGVFPMDTSDFGRLEEAIERLTLNDRSVTVARETSAALSQGFRLGFLGTLHMDVFRQRLEDEYSSEVIITAPTVPYKVVFKNGEEKYVSNPTEFPDMDNFKSRIDAVEEPMVVATIIVPNDYIGAMMDLCSKYRATQLEYKVLETTGRAMLKYSFPLSEIVTDFFSALKSASSGFASFDYEEAGYEASDMVKMNILLNGRPVDALAMIVHRSVAQSVGKEWVRKMKEVIPRQLYELSIQAAVGHKVVARENISAMRKDVTAGLYGGHYERKLKQLNKQKEGKKRLKALAGNIHVPQTAFFDVLSSRPRNFSTSSRQCAGVDPSDYPPAPPDVQPPRSFAQSESTGSPLETLLQDFESGLPAFPSLPARRQAHRPLARQPISPTDRSQKLSNLHRLSTSPPQTVSSDDVYATYADVYFSSSSADVLTPTEIKETLKRLHKLDSDPNRNADRSVSKERLGELIGHLKNVTEDLGPRDQALIQHILLTSDPLSRTSPNEEDIDKAEKRLVRMTKDGLSNKYRPDVAFFLNMLVKSHTETARFQSWWDRVEQEMTLNSELYLVRAAFLSFHGRLDDVTALVQLALDNSRLNDHTKVILLNFLLVTHADYAHWDVVSGIYSSLHSPRLTLESAFEPLAFPLNNPVQVVKIPRHLRASRSTYSALISALSFAGYIEPALRTVHAMYEAEFYPFVSDYAFIFKAFASFGHAPPQDGPATILFPKIRFAEIGRRRADLFTSQRGPIASSSLSFTRIWQKGAWAPMAGLGVDLPAHIRRDLAMRTSEGGDRGGENLSWSAAQGKDREWTLDVAQQLFLSLLALRPGTRGVLSHKAYLAPNPDQVWNVLMAFSRMSGGDREVLLKAWTGMRDKFSGDTGEKWIGWRMDRRLSRVVKALEGNAQ